MTSSSDRSEAQNRRTKASPVKEHVTYPRACPHCGKSFPTSTRYHKHIYFHTAERKFKCDHPGCDKSYKRKHDLEMHKSAHLASKPFKCVVNDCNRTFARKADLHKHVRCVHNGLSCEACGLRFRKKAKLQRHWQLVHEHTGGAQIEPGKCPDCGKTFKYREDLEKHIVSQHARGCEGKKQKKYKCTKCDKIFDSFLAMVKHRKEQHLQTYACECGWVGKRPEQLKHHIDVVHRQVVVRCQQEGCPLTFMSKPAMRLHFRTAHANMKDFKCSICDKSFAYKGVLRRHCEKVHKVRERGSPEVQAKAAKVDAGMHGLVDREAV